MFTRKAVVLASILAALALADCGSATTQRPSAPTSPATPHSQAAPSQAPTSATGWKVPDPALTSMFPAIPGFGWESMSPAVLERNLQTHYADLGNHVQGADLRYVITPDGSSVGIVSVLALAPAYASPQAAAAELRRLEQSATRAWGFTFESTIGGHKAFGFIIHGMQNWYWVSGTTIVSVVVGANDSQGDTFARLYAASTP